MNKTKNWSYVLLANVLVLLLAGYIPLYNIVFVNGSGDESGLFAIAFYGAFYSVLAIITVILCYFVIKKFRARALNKSYFIASAAFQLIGIYAFLPIALSYSNSVDTYKQSLVTFEPVMNKESIIYEGSRYYYEYTIVFNNKTNHDIKMDYRVLPMVSDPAQYIKYSSLVSIDYNNSIEIILPPGVTSHSEKLPLYELYSDYCKVAKMNVNPTNSKVSLQVMRQIEGISSKFDYLDSQLEKDWASSFVAVKKDCDK